MLIVLLLSLSCAAAKDDVTKELITSNGKTRAWEFLKKYELDADPFFQKYNWN